MPIKTAITVALLSIVLLPKSADGEPIRFKTPITVTTQSGVTVPLPPVLCLPESDEEKLDRRLVELQDWETHSRARIKVLEKPNHNWKIIGGAMVAGVAIGFALGSR